MEHLKALAQAVHASRLAQRRAEALPLWRELFRLGANPPTFRNWVAQREACAARLYFIQDNFPIGRAFALLGVNCIVTGVSRSGAVVLAKNGEGGLAERNLSFEVLKSLVFGSTK